MRVQPCIRSLCRECWLWKEPVWSWGFKQYTLLIFRRILDCRWWCCFSSAWRMYIWWIWFIGTYIYISFHSYILSVQCYMVITSNFILMMIIRSLNEKCVQNLKKTNQNQQTNVLLRKWKFFAKRILWRQLLFNKLHFSKIRKSNFIKSIQTAQMT